MAHMNRQPAQRAKTSMLVLSLTFLNISTCTAFTQIKTKRLHQQPVRLTFYETPSSPLDTTDRADRRPSLLSAAPTPYNSDQEADDFITFQSTAANRRDALGTFAHSFLLAASATTTTTNLFNPPYANADDAEEAPPSLYLAQPMGPPGSSGSKPYAPPEYLLPASRVKVYVDTATEIATDLTKLQQEQLSPKSQETNTKITNTITFLGQLLLTPPSFIQSNDPKRKIDTSGGFLSSIEIATQKQKERTDRQIEVGLAPRAFEVFELSGERRQWNRLQKQERAREDASEIRRAFNIYTTNLVFDDNKYKFKGSKEEKSKLIRNDKLPTASAVIRSDLDLRDLFRNQVQTCLEDVRAEYVYQVKQQEEKGDFDGTELLGLLKEAQVACDKWFSFIDEKEARFSLEVAQQESAGWYR